MAATKVSKRLDKLSSGSASVSLQVGVGASSSNQENRMSNTVELHAQLQIKIPDKYSLRPRSIQKRIEVEQKKHVKRQPKPKQKPAPLSKYRRKTANARERTRMKEINQAFETLRQAIPHTVHGYESPATCQANGEKWTKITTLRLAMNYIEALNRVLHCPQNLDDDYSLTLSGSSSNGSTASHLEASLAALNSFATDRGSLSSLGETSSDLGEYPSDLLSEASSSLGDPLDSFDDIPNISMGDAFDIFLESDGDSLNFNSDLSDQPTP